MDGNGGCLSSSGSFFYSDDWEDDIDGYIEKLGEAGTVITLILSMDKQSVCYRIDNKDYEYVNADCVTKGEKYRLAVTMDDDGES